MNPYVIAEIGVNYYDTAEQLNIEPLEAAKLYIDKALEAKVNCAKFQTYKASLLASKNSPAYWDTELEPTQSQYELFLKYDKFGEKEYHILSEYAHSKGLDFTSTPFDYQSADYLNELVDFYKISSSDITNIPFLRHIAKKNKRIVLSVGASYISEVDEAVRAIKSEGCDDITLMHCVLSYPTDPDDANLKTIKTLKNIFPSCKIGFSDHIIPDRSMMTLAAAYMMGAEVIEKHFTLNKKLKGNDHYHAGDVNDFILARDNFDWINRVLGSGAKTVYDCEKKSRVEARRSLVLTRDKKAGETITRDDIIAKRPGCGISPNDIDKVVGRKVTSDLIEDTILQWNMI